MRFHISELLVRALREKMCIEEIFIRRVLIAYLLVIILNLFQIKSFTCVCICFWSFN